MAKLEKIHYNCEPFRTFLHAWFQELVVPSFDAGPSDQVSPFSAACGTVPLHHAYIQLNNCKVEKNGFVVSTEKADENGIFNTNPPANKGSLKTTLRLNRSVKFNSN